MAITYDINLRREGGSAQHRHSGGQLDALQIQATTEYQVLVTDPADPDFDGTTIMETDVLEQPELPKVAKTVWNFNGRTIPYLTCLNKRATRDPDRKSRFTVVCDWSTGTQNAAGNSQAPPATLAGYNPRYDFSLTGYQKQLWADLNDAEYISPSGSQYSEPLLEDIAQQVLQISQYEPSITYDTMESRLYAANSVNWGTRLAFEWKITDITASTVQVPLAGSIATAALVVYTLTKKPGGWNARRGCVDTHYLETPSDLTTRVAFRDSEDATYDTGKIKLADGTKDNTTGAPDENVFSNHKTLDFNGFIQPEV